MRVAARDLSAEQDCFEIDRDKGYGLYKYKAIRSMSKKVIGDHCLKLSRLFWRQRGMRLVEKPINRGALRFWKTLLFCVRIFLNYWVRSDSARSYA